MGSERLSVIVSTCFGVETLRRCLHSLKELPSGPDQVVVVHDGPLGSREGLSHPGLRLVHQAAGRGIGAVRNAGAYAADGEILAFIDSDAVVSPGWAEALRRAFAQGACLVGGTIRHAGAGSLTGGYAARWHRHDPEGRNGFLPLVSGTHLAIRRDVFLRLGGFDEHGPVAEDVDLSLRAQLAGYPLVFVPEAELVHERQTSFGDLFKEGFRRGRAERMTEQRFRKFPFMSLDSRSGATRALASSAVAQVMTTWDGDRPPLGQPLLHAGMVAARRLGVLATDLRVLTGAVPLPGAVVYRDPEQHNTSSPLPDGPALLILGDDRLVMTLLRLALEGGDELIAAPPGLEHEATARWDQPAPWSRRLVRTAVRRGWPLDLDTGAKRLEREQPRTWGEAFLMLHRVHAWAHGRPRFALAALGPAGYRLVERLPDVPLVTAGEDGFDGQLVRVTRRQLLRDPRAVGAELNRLIGESPT